MSNYSSKRPLAGMFFVLTGIFIYSLLNILVKNLSCRYSVLQITFFRVSFAILPAFIMLYKDEPRSWHQTENHPRLITVGLLLMASLWCLFESLHLLNIAQAQTLCFTSIVFVAVLAPFLLKESLTAVRIFAMVLGFIGVVFITQPSSASLNPWGVMTSLLFAFANAIVFINFRIMGSYNSTYKTTFFLTLYATLWMGMALLFINRLPLNTIEALSLWWATPPLFDFMLLSLVGLTGGIGQICVTHAFRLAPATVVSPLTYTGIVWGLLFDWMIFNNIPTPLFLIGASLTITSGLSVVFEDKIKLLSSKRSFSALR